MRPIFSDRVLHLLRWGGVSRSSGRVAAVRGLLPREGPLRQRGAAPDLLPFAQPGRAQRASCGAPERSGLKGPRVFLAYACLGGAGVGYTAGTGFRAPLSRIL